MDWSSIERVKAEARDYVRTTSQTAVPRKSTFSARLYGDNVFEKRGIRRDRTGGSGKGRYLQGKTGILKRDGPASASVSLKMFEREGVDVVGVLFSRLEPLRARRSRAPRRARCDIGKPPKA